MSFRIIISASSAPTQANVPVAGLQNVLYISLSRERIKDFPQFATPWIYRFLYFPLPCCNSTKTAWAKQFTAISFHWRRFVAAASHCPLHSARHSPSCISLRSWRRDFSDLSNFASAVANSSAIAKHSSTTFPPLLHMTMTMVTNPNPNQKKILQASHYTPRVNIDLPVSNYRWSGTCRLEK